MAKGERPIVGTRAFSTLDEQTQALVEQVHTTKCPLIVTKDGEPAIVLIDASQYEETLRRLALMERIARGERDFADGRTRSQEEVETLIDAWLADGT